MVTVDKLWPGETFVLLGCGPSLTQADVDFCRGKARIIAINMAYTLAPWADVLYGCDEQFWSFKKGAAASFKGLKYALESGAGRWPGVQVLRQTGKEGLELDPTALRTGRNSGYQAMNLAVHLGAVKIVQLGYDMAGGHFCRDYPGTRMSPFDDFIVKFQTLVKPLAKAGVSVVNCSRQTALTCFPRQSLASALSEPFEAAS